MNTGIDDFVGRLRKEVCQKAGCPSCGECFCEEIAALRGRIMGLEVALKPFRDWYDADNEDAITITRTEMGLLIGRHWPAAINDDPMADNREVLLAQMRNQKKGPSAPTSDDPWQRLKDILQTVQLGRIPSAAQEDDCLELILFLETISRLHRASFP